MNHTRRQAVFLDDVGLPNYLPTRLTMVLLKRLPYRAALEGYIELQRSPTVRLEEPALEAPLENTPYLYQTWGTLEVISAFVGAAGELGYQITTQSMVRKDKSGIFVHLLPDGKPVVAVFHPVEGVVAKLLCQRRYPAGARQGVRSVSYTQIPDVALEIEQPSKATRVYLFDPKYKLDSEFLAAPQEGDLLEAPEADERDVFGKPKKVDIDKMHAYRDAIRDASGRRVVEYAAILYPGQSVSYGTDIEAVQAYPGSEHDSENRLRCIFTRALSYSPTLAVGQTEGHK